MPILRFQVQADYDEVVRLRNEIDRLETTLKGFGPGTAESTLASVRNELDAARAKFENLASSAQTSGAKMESSFNESLRKMRQQGDVNVHIRVDNSAFRNANRQFIQELDNGLAKLDEYGESIRGVVNSVSGLAGFAIPMMGVFEFLDRVKSVRSEFQDMESSMQVFLGSQEKGTEFTEKLQAYAWYNMFDFKDLVNASQQMIAYGHSVDTIIPSINALSEVATATHAPLGEMVALFNKAKAVGYVDSQAIQSWALRGFVIKDTLKEMGEQVNGTKITFDQLNKALKYATDEGGMFHGIMDSQMNNISASIGQLQDNTDLMFNDIGKSMQEPLRAVIDLAANIVDNWQSVAKALGIATAVTFSFKAGSAAANKTATLGLQETIDKVNELDRSAKGLTLDKDIQQLVDAKRLTAKQAEEYQNARNRLAQEGHTNTSLEDLRKEADRRADLNTKIDEETRALQRLNAEREKESQKSTLDKDLQEKVDNGADIEMAKGLQQLREKERKLDKEAKEAGIAAVNNELGIRTKENEEAEKALKTAKERQKIAEENLKNIPNGDGYLDSLKQATVDKAEADEAVRRAQERYDAENLRSKQMSEMNKPTMDWIQSGSDKEVAAKTGMFMDKRKEIAENREKLEVAEKELSLAEESNTVAEAHTKELKEQLDILDAKRNAITSDTPEEEKTAINKEYGQVSADYETALQNQIESQNALNEAKGRTEEANQKLADSEREISDMMRDPKELDSLIEEKTALLKDAEEDVALRQQANEKAQEALQVAQQEKESADAKVESLRKQLELKQQIAETSEDEGDLDDIEEELSAALKEQEAAASELLTAQQEAETVAKELNTAETTKNNIATEINTAEKAKQTASTAQQTISERANSAAMNVNTASTKKNSLAKRLGTSINHLFKASVDSVKNSFKSLWATMATNPIGLILSAVSGLIAVFTMFKKEEEEATEETEKYGESAVKTKDKVENMYALLEAVDKNSNVYKETMRDLVKIAKEHNIELGKENEHYENLKKNKAQLIELIMEEGRQRQIANDMEELRKEKEDAYSTMKTSIKDVFDKNDDEDIKNMSSYLAAAVAESSDKLAAEINQSQEKVNKAWENYSRLHKMNPSDSWEETKKAWSEYQKEIDEQNNLMDKVLADAQKMAEQRTGHKFTLDPKQQLNLKNAINTYSESAVEYAENTQEFIRLNKKNEAELAAAGKVEPEVDYSAMTSIEDLNKGFDTVVANIEKTNKQKVYPKADTSELDNMVKTMIAASEKADETNGKTVAPKVLPTDVVGLHKNVKDADAALDSLGMKNTTVNVDKTSVDDANESLDTTKEGMDDVDNAESTPTVNTDSVDEANDKLVEVQDNQEIIDNTTSTPYIDTKYLDIAKSKLDDIKILLHEVGGQTLHLTDRERSSISKIMEKAKKKGAKVENADDLFRNRDTLFKEGKLSAEDYNIISFHERNAKKRSRVIIDGKTEYLTANQAIVMQSAIDRNGGVNMQNWDKESVEMFNKNISNPIRSRRQQQQIEKNNKELETITKQYQEIADDAKNDAARQTALNQIKQKMSSLDDDNVYHQKLKKNLEKIKKDLEKKLNKKSKKSNDDPKMRKWNQEQAEKAEKERLEDQKKQLEFQQRQWEIDRMNDGTEKEIQQARLDNEKSRYELEKQIIAEEQKLIKYDRDRWVQSKKGNKIYDWETKGRDKDKDYRKLAEENIGMDFKLDELATKESEALLKVFKEDIASMHEYLKEYGSFEQRKLAITQEYEEKIRNARTEGEKMQLRAQERKDIEQVDMEALSANIDWVSLFDGTGLILKEQLKPLYEQLQEYVKTDEFRNLGADNQKTIVEAMDKLRIQLGDRQTWKDLAIATANYQSAARELYTTQETNNRISEEYNKAEQTYRDAVARMDRLTAQGANSVELDKAAAEVDEARQAMQDYRISLEESNIALQDMKERVQGAGMTMNRTAANVADQQWEITGWMRNAGLTQIAGLFEQLQKLDGAIQMLNYIKKFNNTVEEVANVSSEVGKLGEAASGAAENLDEISDKVKSFSVLSGIEVSSLLGNLTNNVDFKIASEGLTEETDKLEESFKKLENGTVDLAGNLTSNIQGAPEKLKVISNHLNDEGSKAGQFLSKMLPQSIIKGFEEAGVIGEFIAAILGILDMLKDGIGPIIASVIDMCTNAISGLVSNILNLKDGFIRQIGESILSGVGNIIKSVFTLGGMFDWIGGESDKTLHKDMERLANVNEALMWSIQKLTEDFREVPVVNVIDEYNKALDNLKESQKNTQDLLKRSGDAHSKGFLGIGRHRSANTKIDEHMSKEDWAAISRITGQRVKSAADFWTLTPEQMAEIKKQRADLWGQIKTYAAKGHEDASGYMEDLVEYAEQYEEIERAMREAVTDTTFDNISSQFKSALLDMESDAQTFADNFEKMMQQTAINIMMMQEGGFNERLEEWYKEYTELAADKNGLTGSDQNRLKNEWDDMVSDALQQREDLKKAMGWDGSYTQQSSVRTLSGMSQDTAEAIEGRLTALQIATESIRAYEQTGAVSVAQLTDTALQILVNQSQLSNRWDGLEDQIARCVVELASISENTKAVIKPIQQMELSLADIKRNTDKL